ncbi:MAG: hypothetical protein BJ554DRAFT_216 [Olpidium bornovanus]|uniref:Serine/threonine-protein phosphatase 2A 55 kDa regulatory subunit B n=1 Tax=Olpidium bornovanus TaxID=278681 RepID=A0A8H8DIS6_9FUNG|nr:MAG: hypothetical protein BJ554DRAFT_216 [Olpidium bornovanus]
METFLSADDLRINLWNLDIQDQSFSKSKRAAPRRLGPVRAPDGGKGWWGASAAHIVDVKPANMEELTEVITAAEFHPSHCNVFTYSSSKGTVKLNDMRMSALCDSNTKLYEDAEGASEKSFFSEIISSIADVKFAQDGRYIVARDYMTLKVWDVAMEKRPVRTIRVHEHLRGKLCDLYENDCIFDKFECTLSGAGGSALAGSYGNYFHVYDGLAAGGGGGDPPEPVVLQADKGAFKARKAGNAKKGAAAAAAAQPGLGVQRKDNIDPETLDFTKKILHASWHPKENSIAVAATNNLFIVSAFFFRPRGGVLASKEGRGGPGWGGVFFRSTPCRRLTRVFRPPSPPLSFFFFAFVFVVFRGKPEPPTSSSFPPPRPPGARSPRRKKKTKKK